jgi:nitroimidazol reductase NimA-like FMN-containing flavoprotein (pyridoxamine 5'-phosphate oxidase superfamily)
MTSEPWAPGPHGAPLPFDEHLEALSTQECLDELAVGGIGRVAIVVGGVPVVLPVSFLLDGDDIVFLTGSGAKLRAASAGEPVAFEVDGVGPLRRGWSVLVIGEATATDDPAEVEGARSLGLHPLAPGPHDHVVRIRRRLVSGRRFGWPETRPLRPGEP